MDKKSKCGDKGKIKKTEEEKEREQGRPRLVRACHPNTSKGGA